MLGNEQFHCPWTDHASFCTCSSQFTTWMFEFLCHRQCTSRLSLTCNRRLVGSPIQLISSFFIETKFKTKNLLLADYRIYRCLRLPQLPTTAMKYAMAIISLPRHLISVSITVHTGRKTPKTSLSFEYCMQYCHFPVSRFENIRFVH